MASLTGWSWVWVNSESWWWTGRPGVLWFMGSQRVGHDWATELNWPYFTDVRIKYLCNKMLDNWFSVREFSFLAIWHTSTQNNTPDKRNFKMCCIKYFNFLNAPLNQQENKTIYILVLVSRTLSHEKRSGFLGETPGSRGTRKDIKGRKETGRIQSKPVTFL